jgi:hypothetical protein
MRPATSVTILTSAIALSVAPGTHRTLPMRKASCSRRLPEVPWLASEFFPVWGILNELEA